MSVAADSRNLTQSNQPVKRTRPASCPNLKTLWFNLFVNCVRHHADNVVFCDATIGVVGINGVENLPYSDAIR